MNECKIMNKISEDNKIWAKVLHEKQNFEDDYFPENYFLADLQRNVNAKKYEYWAVVYGSGIVTQQICSVLLFIVTFIYLDESKMSPIHLFIFSLISLIVGYILYIILIRETETVHSMNEQNHRTMLDDFKSAILYLVFGAGLSPILMTLTKTISTDTIYAMTTIMLLANLLFHDYGANAALVSQSLSLNAAIFAAVCLASRLSSMFHAFVTMMWAVLVFAFWPQFRQNRKVTGSRWFFIITILQCFATGFALYTISCVATILYALLCGLITFACPAILVSLQRKKDNIHGPWDEAVVR